MSGGYSEVGDKSFMVELELTVPQTTNVATSATGKMERIHGQPLTDIPEDDVCVDYDVLDYSTSLKVLYAERSDNGRRIKWVSEPPKPKETDEGFEGDLNRQHAIQVQMVENTGPGRRFVVDEVIIHSEVVQGLLRQIFVDYMTWCPSGSALVYEAPFFVFFYEWERLNEVFDAQTGPVRHLVDQLRDIMKLELEESFAARENILRKNAVSFDDLWLILKPGIDVYSSHFGHDGIYKVVGTNWGIKPATGAFRLEVDYIDIDREGKNFSWAGAPLKIPEFPGLKPLDELEVIPTDIHPNVDDIKAKMIARGKAFRDYVTTPYQCVTYKGTATEHGNKFNVNGRIIVDEPGFKKHYDIEVLRPVDSPSGHESSNSVHKSTRHRSKSRSRPLTSSVTVEPSESDISVDDKMPQADQYGKSSVTDKICEDNGTKLSDKLLHYCSSQIGGFCLKTKQWGRFSVDLMTPTPWRLDAFDSVVLPQQTKEMFLSVIEAQDAYKDSFVDIIDGKGQGLALLLEGQSGVGKTLIAEAVADKLRRPLYTINPFELGRDAFDLEVVLESIFHRAATWNAIVLMEECELYFDKLGPGNVRRNVFMATFMDILDRHDGCVIMTTSAKHAIDPAIRSRLDLTIDLKMPEHEDRRKLWKHFIGTLSHECRVDDKDISHLAGARLNGRDVRNVVKTAQNLARRDHAPLGLAHINSVLACRYIGWE